MLPAAPARTLSPFALVCSPDALALRSRDTLNNLITKSPQSWQTSVALPFFNIQGTVRARPMARTHVYETHRTPSRRRSSSGTRFAVSHRRSRSPLVALLTPPSRACAVDVRLMQRKLFASNALGRPLAHAGAFARFVSQACPTKESRGCVRDQPLKPMIVVTERAPLTAPVCAAQRRACAGATVTASSAACVPLLVGTANPQATARRCALTVVPPRSQGLGLVIESDFYATDAGRQHFAGANANHNSPHPPFSPAPRLSLRGCVRRPTDRELLLRPTRP